MPSIGTNQPIAAVTAASGRSRVIGTLRHAPRGIGRPALSLRSFVGLRSHHIR
jgi:hypothetical protein